MSMIYVCLIILVVVLGMTEHLSWSILHSLRSDGCSCFLSSIHFTGSRSLILINLKVRSTSGSWRMHGILLLISAHHSSVDRPNMTMTLLLLLRSWPWSTICRIWISRRTSNFLLTVTHLILTSMISTLIIFAFSSSLRGTTSHVHILLLLNATLITGHISWLWLILIFFQKLLIVTRRKASSIQLLLISSLLFLTRVMRLTLSWTLTSGHRILRWYSGSWGFHWSTAWLLLDD